jgi:hypothetical protein
MTRAPFAFMTLEPGVWTLTFDMRGFATVTRDVTIPPAPADLAITMSLKTYAEIVGAGAIKARLARGAAGAGNVGPGRSRSGRYSQRIVDERRGHAIRSAESHRQ